MLKYIFWLFFILLIPWHTISKAQNPSHHLEALFMPPRHYIANYTHEAPVIDGDISDEAWQPAQWSESFVSIKGHKYPQPTLNTKMKMVWNDKFLYIAAKLEEPHVWATLKKRDAIIYHDNDFEVFIDPNNDTHQYFEIEVNAFNTIFDLFMPKPYRNGSRALISWNIDNLKSAVQIQGTLNDPSDTDSSWTVEMAIPFNAISMGTGEATPSGGSLWRINFSRVQWETIIKYGNYVKKKNKEGKPIPAHNWVWTPQRVVNMHYPERWGYLLFKRDQTSFEKFTLPKSEDLKRYLWLVYYKQQKFFEKHNRYARELDQIKLDQHGQVNINGETYCLQVQATDYQFTATIQASDQAGYIINQEGVIQQLN